MKTKLQQTVGSDASLGQKSAYPKKYDPKLLFKVSRSKQREAMGFGGEPLFLGVDIWNAYELSWLNEKGKPIRRSASIFVPSDSPYLAESKSVKLYLNSLNSEKFPSEEVVRRTIENDLRRVCDASVEVIFDHKSLKHIDPIEQKSFFCLDELDIEIDQFNYDPNLLSSSGGEASDKIVSHVFKAHCLCTGQPDWGSIFIDYEGEAIKRESLLKYLISFHDHSGFSENCIEQIFMDLWEKFSLKRLLVFGRFTRRGGIDINPYRSNEIFEKNNWRLLFQ